MADMVNAYVISVYRIFCWSVVRLVKTKPLFEVNKIICGDALEELKKLPDNCVDLILTDPPYGIGAHGGIGRINQTFKGEWDNQTPEKEVFDEMLRVGKKVVIFGGNFFTDKLPVSGKWFVWDKINTMKNHGTNFSDVELIWTNIEGNTSKKYIHVHRGGQVWGEKKLHPTQKPLHLIISILKDCSYEGEIVLDPFMGSGTTCLAAKNTGRKYMGFDIDQEYVDIANKRLYQQTLV